MITVIPFFDHRYPVYRLGRPSETLCNFSLTSRTISVKKETRAGRNRLGLVSSSKILDATLRILRGEEKEKEKQRDRIENRSTFPFRRMRWIDTNGEREVENGMNGSTTVDRRGSIDRSPRILERSVAREGKKRETRPIPNYVFSPLFLRSLSALYAILLEAFAREHG